MDALEQLKKDVDDFSFALAKVGEKIDLDPKSVFAKTKGDMAMAMLNLAASDGFFAEHEAVAINAAIDLGLSREEMFDVIKKNNFPSVDYLTQVPASLKLVCELDKAINSKGGNSNLAGALIDIYNRLFVLTVVSDGKKEENELMSHTIAIKVMVEYAKENR